MQRIYFQHQNIIYCIPKSESTEDDVLWSITNMPCNTGLFSINGIKESVFSRIIHCKVIPGRHKQLFEHIEEMEGHGSRMAYKILTHHPSDPISIIGIDAESGELFSARYACTERQLESLSNEYHALERINDQRITPDIIDYKQSVNTAFLKIKRPTGSKLGSNGMSDELIRFMVRMTEFSISKSRDDNAHSLRTCLSNGAFAPWNTIRDAEGKFHLLYWLHAADRPLGYDLIYFLIKPFTEKDDIDAKSTVSNLVSWLAKYFSHFGIEDFGTNIDSCFRMLAARLELQGRYLEANRVRLLCKMAIDHFYQEYRHASVNVIERHKVLFVMHMPPPVHGASMVGKWIHESEIINTMFDSYYINLTAASSMADIGKFNFGKMFRFFSLLKTIRRIVREVNPELVYITPNAGGGPFIKDSIVVNMLKSMGCNVLAHFHNKGVSQYEKKALFNSMYRKYFDGLKVLLIVPSLYSDMKTYLRIRDLYTCPNGTPLTLDEEIEARRNNEVPEILFLSNMIISKGVLDLLDALYLLRNQDYRFHCTMIGAETPELSRDKIKYEIESRHLDGMVDYLGPRYGSDKDQYLKKADMMVFPTYYPKECFPLVILEAMEYKMPVVSTNEAGIPYSVIDGETGLLCPSQNPIALSEKIAKLIDNPELRYKMGENGFRLRNQKFTLDSFENNLTMVLSRAIEDTKNQIK